MKYLKGGRGLIAMVVLIVIFLVTAISQNIWSNPKSTVRKKVSFIAYGDDSERWENMREGAGLVCEEKEADLVLMTTLLEDDVNEQKEIIEREIEDGADALIIAPCSNEIKEYIDSKKLRIPVVFAESDGSPESGRRCISVDDYELGYSLGSEIAEHESDIVTVAIISENADIDSVAFREKGLRDAIEGKIGKLINWSRNENEETVNKRVFIQRALVSEATDVIVTFDNSTTDALLDALENLNQKSKVYSISTSNKAVYNLYNKEIIALGYSDEFSIGYLSAMYALSPSEAEKKYPDKEAEYRIVRKENMYDEDNQTLLFPFVN
ncbi:MAG: substrate-binding domain-containing protein [Lachnospiraceae bacterium]|nr:substrate-binding domain-containing protein [Lachnospiraceae bacterium]